MYLLIALGLLSTSAYATCGCVCDSNNKALSYIVEFSGEGRECTLPTAETGSRCFDIDCAKCGQILECYVNTGNLSDDEAVCAIVDTEEKFCPDQKGMQRKTDCGQQCSGDQGVKCYTQDSWDQCPAVISSNIAKCKGGANDGRPAELSNFASYRICIGSGGSICEASGTCSEDGMGGVSYNCAVTSACTTGEPVSCLIPKCDSDSGNGQCPCARNL